MKLQQPKLARIAAGPGAILVMALAAPGAGAQSVDTSEWICEFCPFQSGYHGDYEVGATNVSEDSAYLGDATGYDEAGVYADLGGDGAYTRDGHSLRWTLEDLGLESRSAAIEGAKSGRFDYRLAYRELPRRQFNTTTTIFDASGGDLSLPASWVSAADTSGFSSLDTTLSSQAIASDRSYYEIGGNYLPGSNWKLSADYRRQQQEGSKIIGGSYYTNAALLPVRIDYATDEVDLGIRYAKDSLTLALGWYLSDFDNGQTGFGWQHPFTTAAGAEFATLAAPPDNRFQQLTLSAAYAFPAYNAHASLSAAFGEIEQTEPFLAYSSNPLLSTAALPRSDLDGGIDTSRLAFAFTASPFTRTKIRLSYRHDERDNKTARDLWNRVIADSFVSGELELNVPYSFTHDTLRASAEYRLFDTLRVSAGYDRIDKDYDFQEVAEHSEDTGWGRIRWRPLQTLELDARGGTSRRDVDRYDEIFAATLGQNPLLRKYNLAYRYREFGEISLSYSPPDLPLSIVFDSLYAEDTYTNSQLGLTGGEQIRFGADANWLVTDRATVYLNIGFDNLSSDQSGSEASGAADWRATGDDDFSTVGAGLTLNSIADKFDLKFDYTRSSGDSRITIDTMNSGGTEFPKLLSDFDQLRATLSYQRSEHLEVNLELRYQSFSTEDWALQGVAPATIPVVLSLGATPYDDDVFIAGISFRYRINN
ncbi:MAG: MtrB/PioB family decaheme-associated outer membrane protein [Gammaproteobacteria bacterium]|nr:MtrB/PioB family decaheme-associated outer membrane protein [Gammaproteobacteria bacterium]MDH5304245.1 MtrB/PioB family decaheme-associated outer membrane protein [Gammaproteobacteria bacterium]MDH5321438.1 MtrB/PioB family decaheme-associated outer membrane protein [Gammaproteobacteria bacterium]